jgi:hypothetical protein
MISRISVLEGIMLLLCFRCTLWLSGSRATPFMTHLFALLADSRRYCHDKGQLDDVNAHHEISLLFVKSAVRVLYTLHIFAYLTSRNNLAV